MVQVISNLGVAEGPRFNTALYRKRCLIEFRVKLVGTKARAERPIVHKGFSITDHGVLGPLKVSK